MIKKENRLRKNKHFSFIYNRGSKIYGKFITLYYIKSKFEKFKVGFSVSKKIGKANVRNKVKRRLREAFLESEVKPYYNYIIVAKPDITKADYNGIKFDLHTVISKIK